MPLADSSRAIGAVTSLLTARLENLSSHNVTVGRPEPPSNGADGINNPRLNLFLYEAEFDPHMKNTALDDGQEPPLWLVLRYLLTPFDDHGDSDTAASFRVLGDGLRALQSLGYLPLGGLSADDLNALKPNPERLKVTFQEASLDLLSKLMQGTDERYRFSMAFEVRPVMIAPSAPPEYSLLIGVDYTAPPPGIRADEGRALFIEPSMGPVIERVEPETFKADDPPVTLIGESLGVSGLKVQLGPVELPLVLSPEGVPQFNPTQAAIDGSRISAGSHALSVFGTLPSGRKRSSNLVVVGILPDLATVRHIPAGPELELTGFHLGADRDDVQVALYKDGAVVRAFDDVKDPPGPPPPQAQSKKRVKLSAPAVPSGTYRVILRVNGLQARRSPEVVIP
jgi:hypothetical protein